MKRIFATNLHLAERVEQHGEEYARQIKPAIIERVAGGIYFNGDHPAWAAAVEKYSQFRERVKPPAASSAQERIAAAGREAWAAIHRSRGWTVENLMAWLASLPCGECRCKAAAYMRANPPVLDASHRWDWQFHEAVNAGLGKPSVPYEKAASMWGWNDSTGM